MFRKSNKWDSAKDILLAEHRQWLLPHHERKKSQYTKRKLEYWNNGITETRKQRRSTPQISAEISDLMDDDVSLSTPTENLESLTVKQLREIIRERNLKPKGLSKLKKRQLLDIINTS